MTAGNPSAENQRPWHAQPVEEVLDRLETSSKGLSGDEAARRLARFGPNRLPPPPRASAFRVLIDQLRSIVVVLLIAATAISVALGDLLEAVAIGAVLILNTLIGFAMELRARRAMEAILGLEVPVASVVRAGELRAIDAEILVPGDVVELAAGHQVPADVRLIEATDLRMNEAALTGESLPVSKTAHTILPNQTALADRRNMAYKGTTVAAGLGRGVVTATAAGTEVGRIGALAADVEVQRTPLERRLDRLGRRLVWLALVVAAIVAGLGAWQGASFSLMLQTGIALAVAAVPEALPAVATIALAVGVRRMAARHALVRRLPVVESLGSTTVICTDKTRTLTSGEMAVVRVWVAGRHVEFPHEAAPAALGDEAVGHVIEAAVLASRPQPAGEDAPSAFGRDPVDAAILTAARRLGLDRSQLAAGRPSRGLVPFSSERKLMAAFHEVDGVLVAYAKGAPGHILGLCTHVMTAAGKQQLDDRARNALLDANDELARTGLRVLAVASGQVSGPSESELSGLAFAGFIGLADPPAPGVKETIARLRRAGLRTVMLTGDQRLTAEAIGREIGVLGAAERVVEGRELDAMSREDLMATARDAAAFSRITPEHKLRIVTALQASGAIVAMLGDGVNDAPALRQADVGVAMGVRGTDVAKQAAAIVLGDDRFETIAAAVEEGRVIFDNIRKFVFYLFSCNVAEVLVLLVAGLAALPPPLLPLQLLWLNMATDTFPALALAMEPGDPAVMTRPPRDPEEAILSRAFLRDIFGYAALITLSTLGAYLWALGNSAAQASTIAFMTLALAQIGHLGNARGAEAVLRPALVVANPYALAGASIAIGLQVATVWIEPLAGILRVAPLAGRDWIVIVAASALPAVVGQMLKTWRGRISPSPVS
ncbi:MAG: HAD-IC family P-type ATPase [Vicinamibacterales bacterium]|nr:HAD-IC family P-type ATPase [Vicinamibacterales bacterium]